MARRSSTSLRSHHCKLIVITMYLMYTEDDDGTRVYTLKVRGLDFQNSSEFVQCMPAVPSRF